MLAQCAAIWGDGPVADRAVRQLLVREWVDALAGREPSDVHRAVSSLARRLKWFPKLAEVIEALDAGKVSGGLPDVRKVIEPNVPLTPSELAYRAGVMVRLRAEYPSAFSGASEAVGANAGHGDKSEFTGFTVDNPDVSDELRALLAKQKGGRR